jgi:hypothetical protein
MLPVTSSSHLTVEKRRNFANFLLEHLQGCLPSQLRELIEAIAIQFFSKNFGLFCDVFVDLFERDEFRFTVISFEHSSASSSILYYARSIQRFEDTT